MNGIYPEKKFLAEIFSGAGQICDARLIYSWACRSQHGRRENHSAGRLHGRRFGGVPEEVRRRYPLDAQISPTEKMQRSNKIAGPESNSNFAIEWNANSPRAD